MATVAAALFGRAYWVVFVGTNPKAEPCFNQIWLAYAHFHVQGCIIAHIKTNANKTCKVSTLEFV